MFGKKKKKKKKTWFVKILVLKNHLLEMKLKTSFSKCVFDKKTWLENGLPNSPEIKKKKGGDTKIE